MYIQIIHQKVKCLFAEADLGMFSMFGQTGPHKKRSPTGQKMWTTAWLFVACIGIFMACCDIHSVQHDNLWSINIIRLLNSESRITNHLKAAKLHVVCYCQKIHVRSGPHNFTEPGLVGF